MGINDIVMLQVKGTVVGTQHIHTLHFRQEVPDLFVTDLISVWRAGCQASYRALFTSVESPMQLVRVDTVCSADELPAPAEDVPIPADQLGTRTVVGEAMPSYVAALTTVKSALAGRSRQGRYFIGGMREDDNAGNLLVAGHITRLQNYADALKAIFITPALPNWRLVIFSRTLRDGKPTADPPVAGVSCALATAPALNLVVSNRPTTMRSRKFGSGL